jgi:succinate-semialdehyde dehydrogenase / glutarate-semialdehyde dehydrogenase
LEKNTLMTFLKQANLINGEWIASTSGKTIAVTNPATGEVLGHVPNCGAEETRAAVAAAHAAFPLWRAKTAHERATIMFKLADLIKANVEELATLLTMEQGKSLAEARGEIMASAGNIQWFAEEAKRVYGDMIPSPWGDRRIMVTKEPVGVIAAISPWNFPSSMLARKIGPALAVGCTSVVKPASATPFSGLAWGVLCEMAGVPKGVVNILTGSASEIGLVLTTHPDVKKITFTGSTEVGRLLVTQAAPQFKRVSMELGGNAPFIVFDDADLDAAVEGAMMSKFRNSGQTCVCTNRFYVQAGVYDAFAAKFAAAIKALKVGNGLEAGVQQGPLIDMGAVAKVEQHIADAVSKGAKVVTGGKRHALGGSFFEPTLLSHVTNDMMVTQDETFGPLAPLFKFETDAEAIREANNVQFGLACYVYTRDLSRTFRVSEALEYGMVGVNSGLITTEVAPFGGVKDSGLGRESSKYGVDEYLNIKYTCLGGI